MIFRILLLINLISWIHGTLVVNVTQTSYQAEENQNITLEWTFTTRPHMSITSISFYCRLMTNKITLFNLYKGVEVPESQDEQFSGRVQFDKDVLREGRIRLQLSRLRTNDSGLYLCEVRTDDGWGSDRCGLNVTAVRVCTESKREPEPTNTENRGWISIYCGLGLTAAVLTVCLVLFTKSLCRHRSFSIFRNDEE